MLSEPRSGKVPEGINLLDQISDAVILSDIHFVIRSWNLAAEEIYGWKAAEVIGKNFAELLKSKFQVPAEQVIQQFFSQGYWKGEVIHYRKDGSPIHILASVSLVKDEQGNPASVVSVDRDISERKRAEDEQRKITERLSLACHAGGIGIWELDVVNNNLIWDDQMSNLYGTTPDKFSGTYEAWRAGVHPNELQKSEEELQMAMRGEKDFDTEFRVVWPDGTIHTIRALANVQRDASGQAISLIGTNYDITERKQAEEVLNVEQYLMYALMNNLPVQIYFKDCESRFIRINNAQAQSLGLSDPGQAVGKTDFDFFTDEHAQQAYEDEQVIIGTGQPISKEEKETRYDLPDKWVSTTKLPLRDKDEKIIGTFGTSVDITERKLADMALHESEARFRSLFDDSPISLWEEDFSAVKQRLEDLRAHGVKDFNAYLTQHPEVVAERAALVKVMDINKATLDLYGAASKEDMVKNLTAIFPEEGNEHFRNEFMQIASGATHFEMEMINLTLDGRRKTVNLNWAAIPGYESDLSKIIVSIMDITERKLAEERLAQAANRLMLASRAGGVGIWEFDVVNNRLVWDDQMFRLYGITPDQFGGAYEAWQAGVHPEDVQQRDAEVQMALRGEKEFDTVFRVVWPDGSIRNIRALATVQRDVSGQPLSMLGTNWDITEQKQAEIRTHEQLEELRRWYDATLGRENRILALKEEVNKLLAEAGQPPRYTSALEAAHE